MVEHPLIGTHEHPALPTAAVVLWACWLVLCALGLRALPTLAERWRGPNGWATRSAAALTLAAIALRLVYVPATPEMRWRLQYAYAFGTGWGEQDVLKYGLGYPLWTRALLWFTGPSYDAIFAWNAIIGGLSVAVLIALARALGGSPSTALWCGFALAAQPLHAWFSHTDGPIAADLFFALLTLWCVAEYARRPDPRWMLACTCAVASTAQMRVEAIGFAGFAVLLALALTPRFSWRHRAPWIAAVAGMLLLIPHAALVHDAFLVELSHRTDERPPLVSDIPLTHFIVLNPSMQARVLILATPLGLLLGEVTLAVRLWTLLGVVVFGSIILHSHPTDAAFTAARYQAHTLPFAALLAGFGLSWLSRLAPGRLVPVALAVGTLASLDIAGRRTVMYTEHEFFRAHLHEVGSPCTVMSWLSTDDTTLYPPNHLSELSGYQHRWVDIAREPPPTEGCVVYWKAAACTSHYHPRIGEVPLRYPACDDFERAWTLEPIAEGQMAPDRVGPMGIASRYPDEPIPFGFYRVTGPRAPATITEDTTSGP